MKSFDEFITYKELLIKDLCSRLPYGVKIELTWWDMGEGAYINTINTTLEPDHIKQLLNDEGSDTEIKPYLFPLSSMTEEQKKKLAEINPEFYSLICWDGDIYISNMNTRGYDWLIKNHFDYRGLIPRGLAIAVTEENNPYKS